LNVVNSMLISWKKVLTQIYCPTISFQVVERL
jgi:hypothetical protein